MVLPSAPGKFIIEMQFSIFKNDTFEVSGHLDLPNKNIILTLKGDLNEHAWLRKVNGYLDDLKMDIKFVLLDVQGLSSINSSGIREWMEFIIVLQTRYKISFNRVSEIFLEKASFQRQMLGKPGTSVTEFEAPYFCATCKMRTQKILKTETFRPFGWKFEAPPFFCDQCKGPLKFDEIKDDYTAFLNQVSGDSS